MMMMMIIIIIIIFTGHKWQESLDTYYWPSSKVYVWCAAYWNQLLCSSADQTVLFAVIQPVAGAASTNNSLQLVCFHPDQFINTLISTRINIVVFIITVSVLTLCNIYIKCPVARDV